VRDICQVAGYGVETVRGEMASIGRRYNPIIMNTHVGSANYAMTIATTVDFQNRGQGKRRPHLIHIIG